MSATKRVFTLLKVLYKIMNTSVIALNSYNISCRLGLVLFSLLLFELALLLGRGVLVLLVLAHQVVHVALSLSELHLVHALTSVPKRNNQHM